MKNKQRDIIELETAFGWTCPQCKTRNFTDGEPYEMTPEEIQEMALHNGTDPEIFENGQFSLSPEVVQCSKCKTEFDVLENSEEEDED